MMAGLSQRMFLPPLHGAFPSGAHDTLIKAAAQRDDDIALRHARSWLATNEIEDAPFRDIRLLAAVAARFGDRLAAEPAYLRLMGSQRMLWAQAHMAWHEAHPVIARMHQAGIELLFIKGAARIVEDKASFSARVAHDIDIVVRRSQSVQALDVLGAEGWVAIKGVSSHYLREHIGSLRSINLLKGNRGNIDLHMFPFMPGQGGREEDEAFWKRAASANASGVPVLIPSHEDRLALAIALGGIEGHQHSDWLIDSAVLVASGRIRWELFDQIVEERRLATPAAIAMSYIAGELHHDVPPETLEHLVRSAANRPLDYWSAFLQARPAYRSSAPGEFGRWCAKRLRRRAERRDMAHIPDRHMRVRRVRGREGMSLPSPVTKHRFEIPRGSGDNRRLHLRAVLYLTVSAIRRRIEFEVNGTRRHCCRISYRKQAKRRTTVVLEVDGAFEVPAGDTELVLEARPSRYVSESDETEHRQRYGAIPFRLLSFQVRPAV